VQSPSDFGRKGAKFGTMCPQIRIRCRCLRGRIPVPSQLLECSAALPFLDPPYLRTTEPTSSRQPTVPATTATSAGAPPRSPAPVSTEGRSRVGGSSDGQDEQRRIVVVYYCST
jgi:hypothetical protein